MSDFLGGFLFLLMFAFVLWLIVSIVAVAVKATWTHGTQILRTMLAFIVFVVGLVLVGCFFAELQRVF